MRNHLPAAAINCCDVLVICAMKDEYDQLLNVTDGIAEPGWTERIGPGGWIVSDAKFSIENGADLTVTATWADHMGRDQSQAVASRLIGEQPAKCIAMSGICAGRRGKVELGDVIFGDRLWSYDAGKRVVEGEKTVFEADMFQYRPSSSWGQRMQSVSLITDVDWMSARPDLPLENQEDWVLRCLLGGKTPAAHPDFAAACPDWPNVIQRLWDRGWVNKPCSLSLIGRERAENQQLLHPSKLPDPKPFGLHVAPIGTGASVVEDDGIFFQLASSMRKVLGIDMESSALGALGDVHSVPVIVAKGASDYGDLFKDDRYRNFAARASAEYLLRLLRSSVDLIRGSEHRAPTGASFCSAGRAASSNLVLFNNYSERSEEFYLERENDQALIRSLDIGNVWLFGESGTGKTAIINRNLICHEITYCFCDMSPVTISDPEDILGEILCSIEDEFATVEDKRNTKTIKKIADILQSINSKQIVIVIDELSPVENATITDIASCLLQLVTYFHNNNKDSKLRFIISTIQSPLEIIKNKSKASEYFQFIPCGPWGDNLPRLYDIICESLCLDIDDSSRDFIIGECSGSPRILKSIFRKILVCAESSPEAVKKAVVATLEEVI